MRPQMTDDVIWPARTFDTMPGLLPMRRASSFCDQPRASRRCWTSSRVSPTVSLIDAHDTSLIVKLSRRYFAITERSRNRQVYRLPWGLALTYFSEAELRDLARGKDKGKKGKGASTFSGWKTNGVPADIALPRVLERSTGATSAHAGQVRPSSYEAALDVEQQRKKHFTAIVDVIWRLERESDEEIKAKKDVTDHDGPATIRLRAAWNAIHAVWPLIADAGQWTNEDWRRLFRPKGPDYWTKITKRPEAEIEERIAHESL